MTMIVERIEVQKVAPNDHRNGRVQREIDPIASMRKGFSDHLWNKVMCGFEAVEGEAEFAERHPEGMFMERYRELKEREAIGKQKMPWLYT